MPVRRRQKPQHREPTITLINIVFLMLVFILFAGAVAPPLSNRVELVETSALEGRAPPDAAVLLPDGTLLLGEQPVDVEQIAAAGTSARIVPDRTVPAVTLVEVANHLRAAGGEEIWIVTERGLK